MPNYRRSVSPGGTFFFTQVTFERSPFLCDEVARTILHNVIEQCQNLWLFELEAIVLLPDHHHAMWSLPENDSDYSRRWGWLKKTFTQRWLAEGGRESSISEGKLRDGRRGVWQPKFWEHTLRDDDDFNEHLNYIHYNPVKHGLVKCPHHWPYSSFRKWVRRGMYDVDWQCTCDGNAPIAPKFPTPPTLCDAGRHQILVAIWTAELQEADGNDDHERDDEGNETQRVAHVIPIGVAAADERA